MTSAPATTRVRRRAMGALITGQVLGGVGVATGVSVGGVLAQQLAGTSAAGGLASTASIVGAGIAAGPLAGLSARRGRRAGLAGGLAIAAVGAALVLAAAFAGWFWLLLIGMIGFGAATAAGLQARYAAGDHARPGHESRALSIVVWATTIGAVLGPNLAEPAAALGVRLGIPDPAGPFALALLAFAAAAAIIATSLPADHPAAADDQNGERVSSWRLLAEAWRDRLVRLGITAAIAGHSMMVAVMVMTPVHMYDRGMTLTIIGLTISIHVLGMYAASPLFGILADRLGAPAVVGVGMIIFLAAFLTGAFAPTEGAAPVQLMIALGLLGLGWSACLIGGSALVSAGASGERRVRLQGAVDSVMSLGAALLAALAGPVLGAAGYPGVNLLGALALAALIGVAANAWLGRTAGRSQPLGGKRVSGHRSR
ncbi:MFS transporter [Naumannella huperziae]